MPHVKITELLLEVDEWTGFTRHFTHLKSGDLAKDKNLLLSTILADAVNLGLTKMLSHAPARPTPRSLGYKPGTSAMKPTRRRWPSW